MKLKGAQAFVVPSLGGNGEARALPPQDGTMNAPQPVTDFSDAKTARIWAFDLARDGKQLVIARGSQSADVVLISEVK